MFDTEDSCDKSSKATASLSSKSSPDVRSNVGSNTTANSISNLTPNSNSKSNSNSNSSLVMTNKNSGYKKSAAYRLKNMLFIPQKDYHYEQIGIGSWYGGTDGFDGKKTAIGDIFNKDYFTAAHRTLPIPCVVCITNLKNGKKIFVIVNDRGPYVRGRLIDVSRKTSRILGFEREGKAYLKIQCIPKLSKIVSKIFAAAQKGSLAASALYYKMKKNGITVK